MGFILTGMLVWDHAWESSVPMILLRRRSLQTCIWIYSSCMLCLNSLMDQFITIMATFDRFCNAPRCCQLVTYDHEGLRQPLSYSGLYVSGFDSRPYPRNFSGNIGSGTLATQPPEDVWVATWLRSSEIWLKKLKLRLRDNTFLRTRPPVLPSRSNHFSWSWFLGAVAPRIFFL